ncbi:MAG: 4Fe-4S binding protein, partial [Deltaproteobacteria bacterium]|nr:4Fe-4S binding protein [Deltaproteobacteria bacterium]
LIILLQYECWYCGTCANACPRSGAIKFNWPLQSRPYWKNKKTGEIGQI